MIEDMPKQVCVIVPAYNEAKVISDVLKSAQKAFKTSGYIIDIVVVNDGSQDATSKQAKSVGVTVIDHILNSGVGSATATGLSYATQRGYEAAATMDADGQHNPHDIVHGIDLLFDRKADLLIGSRLIPEESKRSDMSLIKRIGNNGLSTITFLLFGVHTTDSQSGMRIYSQKALKKLRWKTSGYEFCSEMLWRARRAKLTIDEYPIQSIYTDYSKMKGQSNWNGVNLLKNLVRQRIVELFE